MSVLSKRKREDTYVAVRPGGVRWALVGSGLLGLLLELLDSLGVLQVVGELQIRKTEVSAKFSHAWNTRGTYRSLILAVNSVVGTFLAVLEFSVTGRVVVTLGSTGLRTSRWFVSISRPSTAGVDSLWGQWRRRCWTFWESLWKFG